MKVRIILSVILVFAVSVYLLTGSSANVTTHEWKVNEVSVLPPPPAVNLDDRFLIGAQNTLSDACCNLVHYDSVGFNYLQQYDTDTIIAGRHYPQGVWAIVNDAQIDRLFADVNTYASKVKENIGWVYGFHNTRISIMRPKLEWLCFGQRSDYRCVDTIHTDPGLWFYTFQSPGHRGQDWPDNQYLNGRYVRYCRTNNSTNEGGWVDNPGMVVSRLRANSEQCRTVADAPWIGDWECDWLIKPSMRIDPSFVQNYPNEKVFRIEVYNQDGSRFKNVDIYARNFQDAQHPYTGQYIEEYFYSPQDTAKLTYTGAWGSSWFYCARGNETNSNNECNHADIQVYWYGNCDMWIDYVRVDNDVADELFKGQWDSRIQDEVTQIGNYKPDGVHPAISNYYIEYTEFNNIPCMGYVNKKIKEYSGSSTLSVLSDWYIRYANHLRWEERDRIMNPEHVKRFFIDSAGQTAFYAENYPYRSMRGDPPTQECFSRIPNTLPKTDCSSEGPGNSCGILALPVSPDVYDEWLQDNMDYVPEYFTSTVLHDPTNMIPWRDRGMFRFVMNLGNQVSKLAHVPFIHMPASHLWYNPDVEVQREPTNEELDLQANLAISYGARGLMYFQFPSGGSTPGVIGYNRGLTEPGNPPNTIACLRQQNVYHEEKTKKQQFIDIAHRVNTWSPYLMSFNYDNTNSYIYYNLDERNALLLNSYFSDIVTYYPSTIPPSNCNEDAPDDPAPPQNWQYDCKGARYLQAAVFKNLGEVNQNYFMIVNRRCAPYLDQTTIDRNGGYRKIKVKFDVNHSELSGYNEWVIKNVANSAWEMRFNKTQQLYIELGDFMPGEGRLYHLVPVP